MTSFPPCVSFSCFALSESLSPNNCPVAPLASFFIYLYISFSLSIFFNLNLRSVLMIQMHTFSPLAICSLCVNVCVFWECFSLIWYFDWTYTLFVYVFMSVLLSLLLLSLNMITLFVSIWIFVWFGLVLLHVSCFVFYDFCFIFCCHFLTKYNNIMPRALKHLSSLCFHESVFGSKLESEREEDFFFDTKLTPFNISMMTSVECDACIQCSFNLLSTITPSLLTHAYSTSIDQNSIWMWMNEHAVHIKPNCSREINRFPNYFPLFDSSNKMHCDQNIHFWKWKCRHLSALIAL